MSKRRTKPSMKLPATHAEISAKLGIPVQRVREAERSALAKIRAVLLQRLEERQERQVAA